MSQAYRLSVLVRTYIEKRQRLKWSTKEWTQYAFNHLVRAIGDLQTDNLHYADIEDFEAYLFAQDLAVSSVKSYLKAISPVFDWAMRRGYCSKNPCKGYKLPRVPDADIHIYTEAELYELYAACAGDNRWQALVRTAVTAGLRKSEALNLRVNDVDFEAQTITVQPHRETQQTWQWTPKNSQRRTLPLTEDLSKTYCAILAELPSGQPYLHLAEKRYWNLRQRLQAGTLTERQRLWPDDNFSNSFRRLRERAKVSGTYHDLRRTCLTHWSYYLPAQELRKLAGHADIETTMRYYLGIRADVLQQAKKHTLGATGLEPATS